MFFTIPSCRLSYLSTLCFYVKFQIIFAIIGLSNRIRILSECALRFSHDCVSSGCIQMVKRFLTSHSRLVYSLNIKYTCVWKEAHSKIKLVIFYLSTLGSSVPLLFSSVNVDDQELTFQVFTFLLLCLWSRMRLSNDVCPLWWDGRLNSHSLHSRLTSSAALQRKQHVHRDAALPN